MLFMCWLCTYFNFFDLVGLPSILNGVLFFAELQQLQNQFLLSFFLNFLSEEELKKIISSSTWL